MGQAPGARQYLSSILPISYQYLTSILQKKGNARSEQRPSGGESLPGGPAPGTPKKGMPGSAGQGPGPAGEEF